MEYTRLGKSGPRVSVIGVGLWQAGSRLWGGADSETLGEIKNAIRLALEYGITLFDTAEVYGGGISEKLLGHAVREAGVKDEVVVATKVLGGRWSVHDIIKSVKRSIARLGFKPTLVQHHWPPPIYAPLCKVARALERLVETGLTEYVGLSNYPSKLLEQILECMHRHEPVSNQVQYNLAYRTPEVDPIPAMRKHGISLIAWSPLAKGALAGLRKPKTLAQRLDPVFRAAANDDELQKVLSRLAERYRCPKSSVALRWLVEKGAIPIPGLRRARRVIEYVAATRIRLSDEDVQLLDQVSKKYVAIWGSRYKPLQKLRYVPGLLQKLVLRVLRV